MKPLIIPIAIGLLAGIGGGTGYAYMKASQEAAHAVAAADSTAAHDSTAHDSTATDGEHGDSTATDSAAVADSVAAAEAPPMTPADSIRALEEARAMLKAADHKTAKGAADKSHEPKADAKADAKASHEPVTTKLSAVKPVEPAPAPTAGATTAAAVVKDARDAAMRTPLPEQRLAKIFGNMAPKDAAKVLDQMSDADVRGILSYMGDKQAAAVLAGMSAARVAAITRGATKAPENKE